MPSTTPVQLHADAQSDPFALLIAQLIESNLTDHPTKRRQFLVMDGRVALVADDMQSALTLDFRDGMLMIHKGIYGLPQITVRATSGDIVDMSRIELLQLGPWPVLDPRGKVNRQLAQSVWKRKIHMRSGWRTLPLAWRLMQLMAVNAAQPLRRRA